jgi:hypothetical protein
LDEDDEDDDEVLGNGADGMSPTMSAFGKDGQDCNSGQVDDLPDWLHEIETNKTNNVSHLLPPPSPRFFLALHVITTRTTTTPQRGFPFFCRRQTIPHGRCLTKTSVK